MKALFDSASVTIERGDDTRVVDNREKAEAHDEGAKRTDDDAVSMGHAMKALFDSASVTIERGDATRVVDRRALPQDAASKQARAGRKSAASTSPAAVTAAPESLDFDRPLRPRASRVLLGWALALGALALAWAYFA